MRDKSIENLELSVCEHTHKSGHAANTLAEIDAVAYETEEEEEEEDGIVGVCTTDFDPDCLSSSLARS